MIKDLQSVSLLDILPPNLLHDEAVRAAAKALDDELQKVTKATVEVLHLPRLDELPEKVVDLLAWQWHVDFYEPALPLANERALVRRSIDWHRRKGTTYAVEGVVSAALGESKVKEWFEYGGKPYHFRIVNKENTAGAVFSGAKLLEAINSVKNARSHLDSIELQKEVNLKILYGLLDVFIGKKRLGLGFPDSLPLTIRAGVAYAQVGSKKIGLAAPAPVSVKSTVGVYTVRTGRVQIGGIR